MTFVHVNKRIWRCKGSLRRSPAIPVLAHYKVQAGFISYPRLGVLLISDNAAACAAGLSANWLGDSRADWDARLAAGPGSSSVPSLLRKHGVPQRLAEALCAEAGVSDRRVAELRKTERAALLESLTEYPLDYDGHEGYAKVSGWGCRDLLRQPQKSLESPLQGHVLSCQGTEKCTVTCSCATHGFKDCLAGQAERSWRDLLKNCTWVCMCMWMCEC